MNKNIKLVGTWLFILVILISVIIILVKDFKLKTNHRYTIGIIYDFEGQRGGPVVKYTYMVYNTKYEKSNTVIKLIKNSINKRYFVMYDPDNPNNSKICLDKPVQDTTIKAPADGWEKLPYSP